MYDCDKGYVLEEGPPGATCIGKYQVFLLGIAIWNC